jgi:hypothetical protein
MEFQQARTRFQGGNEWYGKDPILTRMADGMLAEMDQKAAKGDPQWAGKSFDDAFTEISKTLSPYVSGKRQETPQNGNFVDLDKLSFDDVKKNAKLFGALMADFKKTYNIKGPDDTIASLSAVSTGGDKGGTDEDDFSSLDRLHGAAYESAMEKLQKDNPAKYRRYMRAGAKA